MSQVDLSSVEAVKLERFVGFHQRVSDGSIN